MISFNRQGLKILLLDCFIIIASLTSAWIIRAQFSFFLFDLQRFILVLPYVVLIRVITNAFFEHYQLSFYNLHITDIVSIFKHSGLPSLLFLALRLFSPIYSMRMPLTMIAIEYVFTVIGMIFIRLVVVLLNTSQRPAYVGRAPTRAVLISSTYGLRAVDLKDLQNIYNLGITGILSKDSLEWNSDYKGIRVLGGYELLEEQSVSDAGILILLNKRDLSNKDLIYLLERCNALGCRFIGLNGEKLEHFVPEDFLFGDPDDLTKTPDIVVERLRDHSTQVIGEESVLSKSIERALVKAAARLEFHSCFYDWRSLLVPGSANEIIDIRHSLYDEWCISSEYHTEFMDFLEEADRRLVETGFTGMYLVVLPYLPVLAGVSELPVQRITVLFTPGVFSNNTVVEKREFGYLWDSPQDIAGFILKVISNKENRGKIFYGQSHQTVDYEDISRARDITFSIPPRRIAGAAETTKNAQKNVYFDALQTKSTEFTNLFEVVGISKD